MTSQSGGRTSLIPPTLVSGTLSIRIPIVIDIRRAERHPVCLPSLHVIIVESVTCVAMVPGHVQCVVVAL